MEPRIDLIFLDRQDSDLTNDWKYFRLTSIGDNIEVCPVTFPDCNDSGVPTQTPGVVGLAVAYHKTTELLKHQNLIDRNRSILIGMRERATQT